MNNWKEATIFVSSTFSDMNEERDVLNSYVIPKLNVSSMNSEQCKLCVNRS